MNILLVIDMQNDFVTGVFGTPEAQAIVPKVVDKIKNNKWDRVIATRDCHFNISKTIEEQTYPSHCFNGTKGYELVDDIKDLYTDCIDKNTFACTELCDLNRSIDFNIEIIGVCTDICVISNALMLRSFFPYTNITVDSSCCAGTTPAAHRNALEIMKNCCINILP